MQHFGCNINDWLKMTLWCLVPHHCFLISRKKIIIKFLKNHNCICITLVLPLWRLYPDPSPASSIYRGLGRPWPNRFCSWPRRARSSTVHAATRGIDFLFPSRGINHQGAASVHTQVGSSASKRPSNVTVSLRATCAWRWADCKCAQMGERHCFHWGETSKRSHWQVEFTYQC